MIRLVAALCKALNSLYSSHEAAPGVSSTRALLQVDYLYLFKELQPLLHGVSSAYRVAGAVVAKQCVWELYYINGDSVYYFFDQKTT